jgi:hypothetical protein
VVLLYLAMTGLPDVVAPYDPAELIAIMVERIIPSSGPTGRTPLQDCRNG